MVKRPYGPADTTRQAVTRRLKATGSTDPDVLYAAREELAAPFQRHRIVCLIIIVAGTLVCCTLVLVPIGIPAVLYGVRHHRRTRTNLATIEAAHVAYVSAISEHAQSSARAGTER